MNQTKLYSISDLLERMKEKGLPASRMWLRKVEEQGKLICPRLPNTRGDRVFTLVQIYEIIEAFSPGGQGEWKYD